MDRGKTERTRALLGDDAFLKIEKMRIAVLGLGGVGSAAAEGLLRLGVENLFLADNACVKESNLNRQIIATDRTVGKMKIKAAEERFNSINPNANLVFFDKLLLPTNLNVVFDFKPHCIIDAIDNVTAKLTLAKMCKESEIPLFMSMGTGGRMDPTQLRCGDIKDTAGCGCSLARVLRRELKKLEVYSLPVVYSLEMPSKAVVECEVLGKHPPCSSPFVPPAAGYALASYAISTLLKENNF